MTIFCLGCFRFGGSLQYRFTDFIGKYPLPLGPCSAFTFSLYSQEYSIHKILFTMPTLREAPFYTRSLKFCACMASYGLVQALSTASYSKGCAFVQCLCKASLTTLHTVPRPSLLPPPRVAYLYTNERCAYLYHCSS